MWPKALSQLIDLAPHITRLIPMADRFLQSKTASEDAARNAMEKMADGLRGDLGQVTAAHAGLYHQIEEQNEKLASIAADAHAAKLSADSLGARITGLEKRLAKLWGVALAALLLLAAVCVLAIIILLRLH